MHFHATHATALLAGLEEKEALIVATAAQFVDDADYNNSEPNDDNELMFAVCTGHHPIDTSAAGSYVRVATISQLHPQAHRLVWVPFHFLPGGKGETLEEKLLCVKNSNIAQQMFEHYIARQNEAQRKKPFYWHLLGVASHVYLDTFSHYGFSGISSEMNEIKLGSIEHKIRDTRIANYVAEKFSNFVENYKGEIADLATSGLGHGPAATYPDRPYMVWQFEYEKKRWGNGTKSGWRNNPETFREGLQELHHRLGEAARLCMTNLKVQDFPETAIKDILDVEGTKEERCQLWKDFIKERFGIESKYPGMEWSRQKDTFHQTPPPHHIDDCYRFHQAAAIHRWYILKDLLPEHGIYCL